MFAHRRNKNLKDIVTRSRYKEDNLLIQKTIDRTTPIRGTFKCSKCKTCDYVIEGSPLTFNNHSISATKMLNCKTTNVVYLLVCPCGLGYVGETSRAFHVRHTEHRSAVHTVKRNAPLVNHYVELNHTANDI